MTISEAERELIKSISKSTDLYYHIFLLITEIQRKAFLKMDAAKNRKLASPEDLNPNTRFIDNPVLARIAGDRLFNTRVRSHLVSFADYPELITHMYNGLVASDFYTRYMAMENPSHEDHKGVVLSIISELIAPDEEFALSMEEKSIFWNDDIELAASIAYKTVKLLDKKDEEEDLFIDLYDEEDVEFAKNLFRKSILHAKDNIHLVDAFTNNWDIERVSDVEKIILNMAITELKHFPFIPVKVTFDEYIEIAKCYCSDKSSGFINGVLDKTLNVLKERDEVQKTGRGLIESNE
ncbi:MAG: transcription antitermination factor NusB [Odoribacteraceae bacterium]|jgi:N utilization substance protein B|nr:transcription antitermination factor NusB [Odoribacteraceae bacterium]